MIGEPKFHNRDRRLSLTDTSGVGEIGDILKRLNINKIERDLNQKVCVEGLKILKVYHVQDYEKFLAFRVRLNRI